MKKHNKLINSTITDEEIKKQLNELSAKISDIDIRIPDEIKQLVAYSNSIAQLKSKFKNYESIYKDFVAKSNEVTSSADTASSNLKSVQEALQKVNAIYNEVDNIKRAIDENPDIVDDIDTMNEHISDVENMREQADKEKTEIHKLYRQLFGYNTKDPDTGEIKSVKGLKHELDNTYEALKSNLAQFEKDTKQNYTNTIADWTNQYNAIKDNVESLLPGAMSAGLAEAYKTKRENEEDSYKFGYWVFIAMIVILACVAAIPGFIVIKLLLGQTNMGEVLREAPRITFALSPVYAALIWAGIFQNKKLNLSKKLIEEYSHKEATAKTFAGLAKQIAEVGDDNVSKTLKTKLLEQTLDASAKNPSDCITNHEKSDNPMLSLLNLSEKWIKQAGGVENVSKILLLAAETYANKSKQEKLNNQEQPATDEEEDE